MIDQPKNIGLALSGGGIRAAVFHLGVLKWMAENNMLEDISRISSVSGGSLCIGLIYSHNNYKWPTNSEYLNTVLPEIKKTILRADIQKHSLIKLIFTPRYWNKRVNLLAEVLKTDWGITGNIRDLQKSPIWYINCTTFETGKRFRFTQENMGDYSVGYVKNPDISLADAAASSAGFPVLIGPYKMNKERYPWEKTDYSKKDFGKNFQKDKYIHLWDGGVYDNLGLESVYKMDGGGRLSDGVNYLIVSNASGSIKYKKRRNGMSGGNIKRLLDISMDQVGALRNRNVMDFIKRTGNGMYLKIGNSAEDITKNSGLAEEQKKKLCSRCIRPSQAVKVRDYHTTLKRPSRSALEFILRHGYETAECTWILTHCTSIY